MYICDLLYLQFSQYLQLAKITVWVVFEKLNHLYPFICLGDELTSRESSVWAVKKICELMEVKFSEDYLTWEALDGFDPRWDVPDIAHTGNTIFGAYTRANKSTTFEDAQERKVDLEELEKEKPEMVKVIRNTRKVYEQICGKEH